MNAKKPAAVPLERLSFGAQEAADILGVGRSTVFKLVREGTLKGCKIGKRRVFRLAELEALLERLSKAEG